VILIYVATNPPIVRGRKATSPAFAGSAFALWLGDPIYAGNLGAARARVSGTMFDASAPQMKFAHALMIGLRRSSMLHRW
jgi:hypothetical protein